VRADDHALGLRRVHDPHVRLEDVVVADVDLSASCVYLHSHLEDVALADLYQVQQQLVHLRSVARALDAIPDLSLACLCHEMSL